MLNLLVSKVLVISEEEAQALPDKDDDTVGRYDQIISWFNTKFSRT